MHVPFSPKSLCTQFVGSLIIIFLVVLSLLFVLFFVVLVGFAGFYRMGEIRTLSVKDVSICSEYMSVFIPKRKNDRYREGHTSLLARSP